VSIQCAETDTDSAMSVKMSCKFSNIMERELFLVVKISIPCSVDPASYNMAIIIQQDATEYSLFKSVNCLTGFG